MEKIDSGNRSLGISREGRTYSSVKEIKRGMGLSDYRRFVSYIYFYRNGRKEQNTGFAKVEARNGILRISVQVKGVRIDENLDAYLFVRKEERLVGIFLKELTVSGITGELQVTTDSRNIAGSGYSLGEIAGLWIQGEDGNRYITLWDEEPLKKMELEIFRKEEPNKVEKDSSDAEEKMGADEEETEQELVENNELQEEEQTDPEVFDPQNEEMVQAAESVGECMDHDKDGAASEESVEKGEEAAPFSFPQNTINGVRAQEHVMSEEAPSWMTKNWMMLSRKYTHVQPFKDTEAVDCLRISPRELGIFCQKDPKIGKNTFLLHGYYHFRHLLLIRCEDNTYRLGVPGYFTLQEQRTAAFYGFPDFMAAGEQRGRGRMGYWCRPMG